MILSEIACFLVIFTFYIIEIENIGRKSLDVSHYSCVQYYRLNANGTWEGMRHLLLGPESDSRHFNFK